MKTIRLIITLFFFAGYISSLSSCTIVFKKDNGKHKGWFKNPKNPHNPKYDKKNHPSSNGNGNGKGKKKMLE